MNDTLKTIAKRYSCRSFTDKMPSESDLNAILAAGIEAPSGRNLQNWQIILVKNKELIAEMDAEGMRVMAEVAKPSYDCIMERGGKLFYNASCVAVIAINASAGKDLTLIDLGITAQNIALAAESLGIASCHCGLISYCFAGKKAEEFKAKLKFPQDYEIGLGVLLGYAKEVGTPHMPNAGKITIIE